LLSLTQLSDEAAAYQNEIQALVVVLFPEFTEIFADPCLPSALAVLRAFPSAQAVAEAGIEPLTQVLRAQKPAHYGRPTAQKLVVFAQQSVSSGRAVAGRSISLRILCDQLEHTQANLARLEADTLATPDQRPGGQRRATDPRMRALRRWRSYAPS
jgi:hypothetical protein